MSRPFHSVNVVFDGSSHYIGSYRNRSDADAAKRRYIAWAIENAKLIGIGVPSYQRIDIVKTERHMGPFAG